MRRNNIFDFCCIQCGRRLQIAAHGLCSFCYKQIKTFHYCGCCGTKLPEDRQRCGICLLTPPLWQKIVFVSAFEDPLQSLIYRFKFQQDYWLDRSLARLLLLAVKEARRTHQLSLPELLIPVPLHHRRQWQRGYNQSSLLAQYLSRWLNIPYLENAVIRQRATSTQRGKNSRQREQNMQQAFALKQRLPAQIKRIALIDDVITTGATMEAICRCLMQQELAEIQVWALCRTQK